MQCTDVLTPLPSLPTAQAIVEERKLFALNSSQASEQLKFHSFRSHWAVKYFTDHIRTRREIMLKNWLTGTPHIS